MFRVCLCCMRLSRLPCNDAECEERLKILMTGQGINTQNNRVRVLEYWRKKYLWQAVSVVLIAAGMISAVVMFVEAVLLKLLAVMIILLVAYLMMKELQGELQTRGENLILSAAPMSAAGVAFDYGKGIAKGNRLFDCWKYDVRECRSVMCGKDFILEEDWLYTTAAARSFTLKLTVFEGIVLAVNAQNEAQAKSLVQSAELRHVAEKMRQLFSAKDIRIVADGTQIGLFFKTEKRLFYQFSLLKTNSAGAFLQRLQTVYAPVAEAVLLMQRFGAVDKC